MHVWSMHVPSSSLRYNTHLHHALYVGVTVDGLGLVALDLLPLLLQHVQPSFIDVHLQLDLLSCLP